MKYRIFSFADLYGGQWLVIRMRDLRIVHAAPPRSIWEALRWVKTWGDTDYIENKKGRELSYRAIEKIFAIMEVQYERRDPPDHDQWLRQIERVQKETGS